MRVTIRPMKRQKFTDSDALCRDIPGIETFTAAFGDSVFGQNTQIIRLKNVKKGENIFLVSDFLRFYNIKYMNALFRLFLCKYMAPYGYWNREAQSKNNRSNVSIHI